MIAGRVQRDQVPADLPDLERIGLVVCTAPPARRARREPLVLLPLAGQLALRDLGWRRWRRRRLPRSEPPQRHVDRERDSERELELGVPQAGEHSRHGRVPGRVVESGPGEVDEPDAEHGDVPQRRASPLPLLWQELVRLKVLTTTSTGALEHRLRPRVAAPPRPDHRLRQQPVAHHHPRAARRERGRRRPLRIERGRGLGRGTRAPRCALGQGGHPLEEALLGVGRAAGKGQGVGAGVRGRITGRAADVPL